MRRFFALVLTLTAACSDSNSVSPEGPDADGTKTLGIGGSGDTATVGGGNGGGSPRTPAAGPTTSIKVVPATLALPLNWVGHLFADGYNASNQWTGVVNASWSSSNSAIVAVGDTGQLIPKALGSTTVTATYAGLTSSAEVTVIAATTGGTGGTMQPPVASFTLTGFVTGAAGADTSNTSPITNAIVRALRVTTAAGDTLFPAAEMASGQTSATGSFTFANLPGGSYRIVASPPAGSVFAEGSYWFPAPRTTDMRVTVVLRTK